MKDGWAWVVFIFNLINLFLLTFLMQLVCWFFSYYFSLDGALSTFLCLWKKFSVLTSVNIFSLVRTKAGEPGGFFFCVCVLGTCQAVFMGSAAELVSRSRAGRSRLLYRLHISTDVYLHFAV